MLELRNITKDYTTGAETVHALRGVSINFRRNEFVSILGQSGCGKTTLLNIMGGLDQYTDGDLIINGVSTKEYKDEDWDAYRNHSVGFVFQSYNLIPHQTVLSNVKLALTLSGISQEETEKRAIEALEEVGLGDQINKKPSQMSGGQMQRVAIARALINNPDILLADEPTGALDSETSNQIMALLEKIAEDRLVIMVTHNPELAEEYSTRIIKLSDGVVTDDSDPYDESDAETLGQKLKNKSMSMKTALGLSLNNLMTKKARTILTAFAGSIGIIGIALILSVSEGFQNYIDKVENDTLSSYPLTIQYESTDMTSLAEAFAGGGDDEEGSGKAADEKLEEQQLMAQMFASVGTNDLTSFKKYFDKNYDRIKDNFNSVSFGYGVVPQIYSKNFEYGVVQVSPSTMISAMTQSMGVSTSFSSSDVFFEMMDNTELLDSQYDVIKGHWPTEYNELVLVLQDENSLNDYMAYSLGLRDPQELKNMMAEIMKGNEVKDINEAKTWTYDDILNLEFSLVPAASRYKYNGSYNIYEDMSSDTEYMKNLINNGETLKITAIVCPKSGESATAMSMGVGYLPSLTEHVINEAKETDIVKAQIANEQVDVFSGKTFEQIANNEEGSIGFGDMISIDSDALGSALGVKISEDDISKIVQKYNDKIGTEITTDISSYETAITDTLTFACEAVADDLIANHTVTGDNVQFEESDVDVSIATVMSGDDYKTLINNLANKTGGVVSVDVLNQSVIGPMLTGYGQALKLMAGVPVPKTQISASVSLYVENDQMKEAITSAAKGITEGVMKATILTDVGTLTKEVCTSMASAFNVDVSAISAAFSFNMSEDEITRLIESYTSGNEATSYDGNLRSLGYSDIDNPTEIKLYMKDFEAKENVVDFIDGYNKKMEKAGNDDMVISYTDITGVLMKSVKTITNAVSYVLIAFVAISLIVSSIMIGVITYISVLERTKEIGILRAIGASKKDISRIFNAETIIVGLCAGIIGIVISLLLLIPINIVLLKLTKISALKAFLPPLAAIILIAISVLLTFIAGLIPSGMAAKKDPVEALRTE